MLRVIAHQRVLGLKPDREALVADSHEVRRLIANRRLTLLEEVQAEVVPDDAVAVAPKPAVKRKPARRVTKKP